MNRRQLVQIAFILVASLGAYSFVRAAQSDQRRATCVALCQLHPNYAGRNRTVPDFELPNGQGEMVRFSRLLGDGPVVLNFWTKTCKPCLQEMPSLAELAEVVKPDGIKVVTVCTDEGPQAVRQELARIADGGELPFTVLYDPDRKVVSDAFGTTLFPETWLIDPHGVIRVRIDGARDWSSPIAAHVLTMLGRPMGCRVEFSQGRPVGPDAALCGDLLP